MIWHTSTQLRQTLILLAIACSIACGSMASAAEPFEETSLAFAPADVSFYYSMQRNRDIYDRVIESKAFAKVGQSPLFQLGMFMAQAQAEDPDGEFSEVMEEWNKPENQELAALAKEMVSREIFVYGDGNWAKLYGLQNDVYRSIWNEAIAQMSQSALEGDFDPDAEIEFNEAMTRKILDALEEIELPTLMIGFKIDDEEAAKRQLDRLEELAKGIQPPAEVKMKLPRRMKIGSGDYLTGAVEGFEIDWDNAENETELPEELQQKVRELFENLTFHVSVGVDRGFVLVSIGPSNEHLATLGEGDLLIDRAELAAVREAGERPITSVGFLDSRWVEETSFGPGYVQSWSELAKAFLSSKDAEIDSEIKDMWLVGLDEVTAGIKKWFPKRGSRMSYSWLSEHGFEGYRYNWDENIAYNGDDRLSMLEHVGGDPIFFWLTRHKYRPESWDPLFKLGYLVVDTVEQTVADELDDEQLVHFQLWLNEGRPLLDRAVKLYREVYSAGLADGQSAWVLDAKHAKRSWIEGMPPAAEPLAIPEFASVQGVSDREKIKTAGREGLALIFETRDLLTKAAAGTELPIDIDIGNITQPEHRVTDIGDFYLTPLPADATVPKDLVSTTGLSAKALVSASSFPQAERLLTPTPLAIEGPIAEHEGPAFDATYFNWAKLLDTTKPWINYAGTLSQAAAEAADDEPDGDQPDDGSDDDPLAQDLEAEFGAADDFLPDLDPATIEQIHSVLEVLQCFRQYSSISYLEDEAQVTHYEWRFRDLP